MTSKLCMPRERATGYLLELLERICAGGKYLDCITTVHAFGSWSRGASEVGDVDLNISYDHRLDGEVNRELVRRLATGRDWNTPFRKALKPRRALHIMFNQFGDVGESVLLYERGDSLAAATARVRNIAEEAAAACITFRCFRQRGLERIEDLDAWLAESAPILPSLVDSAPRRRHLSARSIRVHGC